MMNKTSEQFITAIEDSGLTAPEVIEADGKIHRFPSNGSPLDDAGWYVVFDDELAAGAFGCWRRGIKQKWRANRASKSWAIHQRKSRRQRKLPLTKALPVMGRLGRHVRAGADEFFPAVSASWLDGK